MKTFFTLLFIVFNCSVTLQAQSLVLNTTRFVGGDSSCGYATARYSIQTRDGGILFVGETDCYAGGGDIPRSFPDAPGSTDPENILIGKLDSNLNVSWVKVYGGTQTDIAYSAVQTPDGGYAVLSYTQSNDSDVSGNHGNGDYWLARLDSLGNLLWQQCYGGPYDEEPCSIALTPDNGFIMLGVSYGSGDEVPLHYGTEFNGNWFVVKTDSLGNMQWGKTIGGTGGGGDGGEQPYGSIFYADNGFYLVSSTNSTDYDCTDTAWFAGDPYSTSYNYYMFKLDTAGNILWDSSYGGGGGDIAYQAIWDGRDSSIVINGSTSSFDYMVTGNHGQSDMWVIKTDKNGVLKWEKCLGSPSESGNSICISSLGYMAYGLTDPGNIGQSDNWLFALDDTGKIFRTSDTMFGGVSYEYPCSITPFLNGFAATGTSNSSGFTEGINLGPLLGAESDAFISYINYLPLGFSNVNSTNKQMNVYPNPSERNTRIIFPNETGTLTIMNSIGENIYTTIITQKENYIDINIASWASGIYIAKWQSENGVVLAKKFIKN